MSEEGYIDIGEVFIYVPAGVNGPPVAIDDFYQLQGAAPFVIAAPGVLYNDYDPDQDPLTLVGFGSGAKGGTAPQESPDGGFTFIPVSGVSGQYPFTTFITDGLETAESELVLDVQLDPDSPAAEIDSYTAPATGAFTVAAANGLLANDSSPVGSHLTASLYQGYPTTTIIVNADGSFEVSNPGGAKPGSFMLFWYQVTDGQGRAVLQQVSIKFQ